MTGPALLKPKILERASELGFACVGIAAARPSPRRQRFRRFLQLGYQAEMAWLARDPESRCDSRSLLEGASSVICLAISYAPAPADDAGVHVARYARGRDYHRLLRNRCRRLVDALSKTEPELRARICVDTSPVVERDLAAEAGLGWIGRNGCLLNRRFGSYLLLAEIITDLPLPPDSPAENRCGRCGACVQACPTGAIREDGLVDSRRCISYLSIEHRGRVEEELRGGWGQWVFGCDVCQQVCPFNRRLSAGDAQLRGSSLLARTPLGAILEWTAEDWDRLTRGSAARRARLEVFLRNAAIAAGNAADPANRPALERLARHESPHVAEAAGWALEQLRQRGSGCEAE